MLEVFGLPAHILLLHAVVVLAPLAGLGGILYAVRPGWRRALEWPVLVLAVAMVGLTVVTASAGEALEHALPENALIEAHAEQGELLEVAVGIFAGVVVVTTALLGPWVTARVPMLGRAGAIRWVVIVLQVLTVVAGVFLVYQTVVAGHSGAAAAWSDWRTR